MVYLGIILVWIIVFPLTDWYARLVTKKVFKKGSGSGAKVCLTFDDGPDERYTPALLDILHHMRIPAAFFLVGAKAERLPELVRRIESEGHEIGCHTYDHRHAYLLSPWASIATIRKSRQAVERIIQRRVCWFRPPWGALNLFQYLFLKKFGLGIVLWSANARDWKRATGPAGISSLLSRRVKPGSIIVLHDSGGETGAPENTLTALPEIIKKLQATGYQFVSLEEILGGVSNVRVRNHQEIRPGN